MATTPSGPIQIGHKLTWQDFVELPEDGNRYEILDGELVVTPPPRIPHQEIARNLVVLLAPLAKAEGGTLLFAPVAVALHEHTILEPDILYVGPQRRHFISELAIHDPPHLVVEILSSSTARRDRVAKASLYARFDVDHYWVVDGAARSLEAFELDGDRYRRVAMCSGVEGFQSVLFPNAVLDLGQVWV